MAVTNYGVGAFVWTGGVPSHAPINGAKYAIDKNTNKEYRWVSGTTWEEITPLTESTAFAGDVSGTYNNLQIAANAVGTTEIATDAVTAVKIAAGAVGSSELASTTVTPGSYTNTDITVDVDGRITAASNGSGGGLTSVTTNATLTGDGTSGTPLGMAFPVLAPDGSAAAPSYSFTTSPGSGVWSSGTYLNITSAENQGIRVGTNLVGSGDILIETASKEAGAIGFFQMKSGNSIGNVRDGGVFTMEAGDGDNGGAFNMSAGDGFDNTGGAFSMLAGNSTNGSGGGFTASAGSSTTGTAGGFQMFAGSGASGGTFDMRGGDATLDGNEGGAFNAYSGNCLVGGGGELSINSGEGRDYGGFFLLQGGSASSGTGADINIRPGNGETAPQNGKIILTGNGVALPTLTTTQRNALTGVTAGTTIYCSNQTATDGSTGVTQTYNGTTWKNHW